MPMRFRPDLTGGTIRLIASELICDEHPEEKHSHNEKDPNADAHQGLVLEPRSASSTTVLIFFAAAAGTRIVSARVVRHRNDSVLVTENVYFGEPRHITSSTGLNSVVGRALPPVQKTSGTDPLLEFSRQRDTKNNGHHTIATSPQNEMQVWKK